MESSVLTIMYVFRFFLVFKLYKFGMEFINLISDYVICLGSVYIYKLFSSSMFSKVNFNCGSFIMFSLYILQVKTVYHTILLKWKMFDLRVFTIGIHKKHESNHYLHFLEIFLDFEMKQFCSVNYISLVY